MCLPLWRRGELPARMQLNTRANNETKAKMEPGRRERLLMPGCSCNHSTKPSGKRGKIIMTATIVLINMFEVPSGTENEFLEWWKKCSQALKGEPGFIDATLHRKLKPDTRFQYINVADWEPEESLN